MTHNARITAGVCAAVILGTATGVDGPTWSPVTPAAAVTRCVNGFDIVATSPRIFAEGVLARSPRRALVVGGRPLRFASNAAVIARLHGRRWRVESNRALGRDAGFMAVDSADGTSWAVGYARSETSVRPVATRRRRSGGWRMVPVPAGGDATLTDVAVDGATRTWAVGYRFRQRTRHRPWVLRWNGRRFVDESPRLRSGERGRLAAVSVEREGGTWIAGSVTRGGRVHPYIARLRQGAWQRQSLPSLGEAVVADIDVPASGSGWAVGYRQTTDAIIPLVLHWDGSDWTAADEPGITDEAGLLLGASGTGGGRVTTAGARWRPASVRYVGFAARRAAGAWVTGTLSRLRGHMGFSSVDSIDAERAWLAGRAFRSGVATRSCDPAGPAHAGRPSGRQGREGREGSAAANAPHDEDVIPAMRRAAEGLPPVPRLGLSAQAAGGIRLRDRTAEARLPRSSTTWGAVIADFDQDGDEDLFLGRHGSQARLYVDRGRRFGDAGVAFGQVDRHGCAAQDVDDSGLPDLYCSVGGRRGTGIKANQLWLDPGGPSRVLDELVGRVPEPLGRGRVAAFLDVDLDGAHDLFVGQEAERMDGLPSDNRVYRREAPARFSAVAGSGIDPLLSTRAVSTGDVEGDGMTDLLLVYEKSASNGVTGGVRLYRNTGGRFRDVTRTSRIRSIGESDAELADLDADGRADLIQVSPSRIRVSLKRSDGFRVVFERRLAGGTALAVGDANGDGRPDVFVLRQKDRRSDDDVLLLGSHGGRRWRAIRVPSRAGGEADDVYPIDHDGNGLTDFLVLNGKGPVAGPVQLIASFRR